MKEAIVARQSMIDHPECKHCGRKMSKWTVPEQTTWDIDFNYVCFNDECSYFIKGWDWIREKYKANASYRYCVDPVSGHSRPLPVWSAEAMKDGIINDDDNS
jgi:hypothetical protein